MAKGEIDYAFMSTFLPNQANFYLEMESLNEEVISAGQVPIVREITLT